MCPALSCRQKLWPWISNRTDEYERLKEIKTWCCPTCTNKQILEFIDLLPFADWSNIQDSFHCTDQSHNNIDVCNAQFNETVDQQATPETKEERLLELRNKNNRNVLICHQNTNSIQNKTEDLKVLIKYLRAQIIFITETKIDNTYPDEQFKIEGYRMFREDGQTEGWRGLNGPCNRRSNI